MAPRRRITARRLVIITDHALTDPSPAIHSAELAASERLVAITPPRRWRPWALALAVFLHAAVIVFVLLFVRPRQPKEEESPPGVSVVFENGGQPQTTAPPAPRQGPTTIAQAPPPAAPPPPPRTVQIPPEVNLDMPDQPFANVQSAPLALPTPQPQSRPAPHPARRRPPPPQKYVVMNNMSYGNASPSTPLTKHGLNMSLPQSDAQAVTASGVTIKGDIGADWDAALHKWVEEHGYYPTAAVEQNQEGDAVVEFEVDRSGNVTGAHLLRSSGSPFIDQAWLQLFADNQLPPFPPGTKKDHVTVDYSGDFSLIR